MKGAKKEVRAGLWLLVLSAGFTGCVSLRAVHDFSETSSTDLQGFEDIDYTFQQHCLERCRLSAVKSLEIKRALTCNCAVYQKADSITQFLYQAIRGYFDGLADLSRNALTHYHFDALKNALSAGEYGSVQINPQQAEAYTQIAHILLRATTDAYRRKKIKEYIGEANKPIHVLLKKFQFIIRDNLRGELKFRKETLYAFYKETLLEDDLSDYEKRAAASAYYRRIAAIDSKMARLNVFAESLETIAEGHQKLYDNRNRLSAKALSARITRYASDIRDLRSAFHKLKE